MSLTGEVPQPKARPDFSKLVAYIKLGTETILKEEREPKDFEHYVYERAIEAVYGKEYWDWFNTISEDW